MKTYTLNETGQDELSNRIADLCKPNCTAQAWFCEAEDAFTTAENADRDASLEIRACYTADGRTHIIGLDPAWFDGE